MDAKTLRVRVFGGLEVWFQGRRWREFETRKAAALFGYLVVNAGREFSRSSIAALLWPEAGEAQGRQSVRQALYMIMTSLPSRAAKVPILLIEGETVSLNPTAGVWSDLSQFLDLLGKDTNAITRQSSHILAHAVELYRGELLAGLAVRDAAEFELWLVAEQEHFRYLAIDALQCLASEYLARGEYRLGIQYARRLVAMDPLREEGHRLLMSLLAAAGNRAAAVRHFRSLVETLRIELGAAPAPQTAELHQRILNQVDPPRGADSEMRPRPLVPLVGRERELVRLREIWPSVVAGHGRVTVVEGEAGVGKTRLLRSLLDELARGHGARIVAVATEPRRVQPPFAPLDQVVARLREEARASGCEPLRDLTSPMQRAISAIAPARGHSIETPASEKTELTLDLLAESCTAFLRTALHASGEASSGLILFLDDLHHAPASGLGLLREVARRLAHEPVWFLGACEQNAVVHRRRLAEACEAMSAVTRLDVLTLDRLEKDQVTALATELVAERDLQVVAGRLLRASGGLPLGVVMQVNLWWDEGLLVPVSKSGGGWELGRREEAETACDPHTLTQRRVEHLSPFLRRVLTLAAILGSQFDGSLLAEIEGETEDLVMAALDRLLDRWFLLPASRDWTPGRGQRTAMPPELGVRATRYEFDHDVLRQTVLARVSPQRRRTLHGKVAHALERLDPALDPELLAHHLVEAGDYPRALVAVRRAIDHRRTFGVSPSCLADLDHAEQVLTRACRRFCTG